MHYVIVAEFWVLLVGTIFAWSNFGYELFKWMKGSACVACNTGAINPFLTPCFYGAIFFTIAFVLSVIILVPRIG